MQTHSKRVAFCYIMLGSRQADCTMLQNHCCYLQACQMPATVISMVNVVYVVYLPDLTQVYQPTL